MAAAAKPPARAPYVQQTLDFLDLIFARYPARDFAFRLWEGTRWTKPDPLPPAYTVVLNHPAALRRMFLPPSDTRLALAYVRADFDLEGRPAAALYLGRHLWDSWRWADTLAVAVRLLRLPARRPAADPALAPRLAGPVHSPARDLAAVQFHYDVSNDFYRLWLDPRMVYSCAYFARPAQPLADAQLRKLDHICRKLRLRPGDRLLDVGCGWGALVIHAAKRYRVEAVGVTLSDKQVALARERVAAAGVADRVSIRLCDFRDVAEDPAAPPFDKLVSVGMVEHVGRHNLAAYFAKAFRLLKPGGVMLNHGITLLHEEFKSARAVKNGFFAKYIFPDGDLQPLVYVLGFATAAGFEIRDLESLREHYALTLNCWRERFDAHEDKIVDMMGREAFRLWRLYLIGAGWGFESGIHSIYQALLYKTGETGSAENDLPLTRDDWYRDAEEAQ